MADSAQSGEQYARKNRFQRRWYKLMMALASIVVFCTTYALILPAITLEQQCRIPEHQHTDDCYTQITTVSRQEFACHWDGQSVIIHHHDSYCYDENGTLRCELPEVEEHIHGGGCYQRPLLKEGHSHSELCDSRIRGELTCQEHVHTESCYSSGTNLVCTELVTEGHAHGEGCFDEESNLICDLEETSGHSHGETCYKTNTWLSCGLESDHVHTDDCYSWETVQTCNQEECDPVYGDLVLTCTEPEIIYHAHDDSCYNEEGVLVCEEPEVLSHQHSASCWQTVEEPADTENLTCGQEEWENHTHTERCRGTWVLTCGLEDHGHTEECIPEPVYYCGMEPHTHLPACYDEAGNLTCQLEEHVHTEECLVEIGFATFEMTETTAPVTTGEPLEITTTKATLSYRTKDAEGNWSEWIVVTNDTTNIPGNASFKLEVNFTADVEQLKAAGYQMIYSPLPAWFRNVTSTDYIKSGDKNVGTMAVKDGTVILTFYETWEGLSQKDMTGSFYVEAEADLKSITGGGNTDVVLGDTTIKVNFDGDLIAKYGEVTIDKAVGKLEENVPGEDGKYYDYITYTLTVKAGADGCPEVKVTDSFTSGSQYVDGYILPEGTTNAEIKDGKLTWNIGNMDPNTTQTLTYKVKLDPNYLGAKPKNEVLTNVATVYSKDYSRTTDSQTFTPKGTATMSKIAADFIPNESGGGTIRYTVWVHADESNTYTLENVTIWDALDGAVDGSYKTEEKFLEYISYDEDSFAYYIGGSKEQNGPGDLWPTETTEKPVFADNKKSFRFNVGNLAPGDNRLLIYEVTVDAGVFTQSNEDFKINNRAYIVTDPNRSDGAGKKLESYKQEKEITTKKWARKLLGEKVETAKTITMGEDRSFEVPAGSQEYKVVVNETGDWDVSSAVMKDDLKTEHMAYVGYVRVEAYQAAQSTNYGSDAAAAEALGDLNPVQTVWVDINGKTSFEFTPEKLGFPKKNYAYLLTYYAQPQNMDGYSTVIVANEFDLKGTVGINGNIYYLGGIHVSASVQLEGSNHFGAQKRFWYYDAAAEGQEKGTMYWVLKLSGNTIPMGTMLLDAVSEGPHTVGKVERAFIADYGLEFSEDQTLDNLGGTPFENFVSDPTDKGLELTLSADVELNGQCLYFIVSTYPTTVPQTNGQSQVYKNTLSTKDPGEDSDWVKVSEDQTYVVAGNNLYKSMWEVFEVTEVDAANESVTTKHVNGETNTKYQPYVLAKSGTGVYVSWLVTVNEGSTLSGRYRITENVPEGMEVTYIQQFSSPGYSVRPKFVDQGDIAGYTKTVMGYRQPHDLNPITAYYYTKGQEVIWDVEGLEANPDNPGSKKVIFLVVCKVTDSELLLGGKEKNYVNQVTLSSTDGTQLGQGSADVTLQIPTLGKTGTFENIDDGRYPFEIQLNELGTDLVPGAETIELIDEMCDYLILDLSSIQVVNTKTKEPVQFISALNGHTLTLTLPDDQPLTVTYETTINAVPGSTIAIENKAYWKVYASTPDSSVTVPELEYKVGAQVITSTNPELTISKVDQYDTGTKLGGAQFTLTEVELDEGEFVEKKDGLTLIGTTDKNGEVVFGEDDTVKLQCNVPYQLVETAAPEGYALDETPRYFVFAQKVNGGYPEELKAYQTAGASILSNTTFTYTVTNHKGEIVVTKQFQNADGSALEKVDGTYTFGLFENGSARCLQKATVKWANGTVTPTDGKAHFTNVALDKEYVVCELNDSGEPIESGSGTVSGIPFVVSYQDNGVTVDANNPQGTVTVTNRINYPELPHTGGAGSEVYTAAGATLTAAALWLMCNQRKRRREGS